MKSSKFFICLLALICAVSMLFCCVACDVVARQGVMLPVNTITSLLGIPVIIYVVLRNSHRQ